jgi:hypothetical protein
MLFQIPKNSLFQTLKEFISNPQENLTLAQNNVILDPQNNPYLAPKNTIPRTLFQTPQKNLILALKKPYFKPLKYLILTPNFKLQKP